MKERIAPPRSRMMRIGAGRYEDATGVLATWDVVYGVARRPRPRTGPGTGSGISRS